MHHGVVKFFNQNKGFGFIKTNESGEDIFVHVSDLRQPIKENDKVEFDVVEGKKGRTAVNVSVS